MRDSTGYSNNEKARARAFRDAFREGQESAKVRSYSDALLRASLLAVALAAAWVSPVGWYWKLAIFVAAMFVIGVIVQLFATARERRVSAFSSWTDAEVRRWLHLRAIEWASWPAFVSQLVAPLLLIAWPWYAVVAGVWGVNALWSLVRYRFVSPSLANLACAAVVFLKWPLAIGCAIYLFIHHAYLPATLALIWPLIAGFIFFGGQVERIELSLAKKIGYVSEES